MTPEQFVECFAKKRDELLSAGTEQSCADGRSKH
jgi:hypothetical protein